MPRSTAQTYDFQSPSNPDDELARIRRALEFVVGQDVEIEDTHDPGEE